MRLRLAALLHKLAPMRPFLILALLATACVPEEDVEPPPPPPIDLACVGDPGMFPDRFHFLSFESEIFRQGATIGITPSADRSPAGTREVPMECTSDWRISGPATLAADRRSITIAPDAPSGAEVSVSYISRSERVGRTFRVVARDAVVLTGIRGQRSVEGCGQLQPVRELEFSAGNRFSVTFLPFETYKDYWGTYSFDAASGRLVMTVSGGNFVPAGLDLEGTARVDGGRLILEGMYLGSREPSAVPAGGCRYSF